MSHWLSSAVVMGMGGLLIGCGSGASSDSVQSEQGNVGREVVLPVQAGAAEEPAIERARDPAMHNGWVNLHVDSDRTTMDGEYPALAAGDLGAREDALEMTTACEVMTFAADSSRQGIPDFANGIDRFGHEGEERAMAFQPMVVDVSSLGVPIGSAGFPPPAAVRFHYSASDPGQIREVISGPGPGERIYTPAEGNFRIWTKNGPESRKVAPVEKGGDYVVPDHLYSLAQLGLRPGASGMLYIEAIGNGLPRDRVIRVDLLIDGKVCSQDSVLVEARVLQIITGNDGMGRDEDDFDGDR